MTEATIEQVVEPESEPVVTITSPVEDDTVIGTIGPQPKRPRGRPRKLSDPAAPVAPPVPVPSAGPIDEGDEPPVVRSEPARKVESKPYVNRRRG